MCMIPLKFQLDGLHRWTFPLKHVTTNTVLFSCLFSIAQFSICQEKSFGRATGNVRALTLRGKTFPLP